MELQRKDLWFIPRNKEDGDTRHTSATLWHAGVGKQPSFDKHSSCVWPSSFVHRNPSSYSKHMMIKETSIRKTSRCSQWKFLSFEAFWVFELEARNEYLVFEGCTKYLFHGFHASSHHFRQIEPATLFFHGEGKIYPKLIGTAFEVSWDLLTRAIFPSK